MNATVITPPPGTFGNNVVFVDIYNAYQKGTLKVPTMPSVAAKIRDLSDAADPSVHDVAKILTIDPGIAGKLVFVANSPAYRGAADAANIKDAVNRLGIITARNIAIGIALAEVFVSNSEETRLKMQNLWATSVKVGALSWIIANHEQSLNPETAMLAGLLHRVGEVAILGHLSEYNILSDDNDVNEALVALRNPVGRWVLERWKLDPIFLHVLEHSTNWIRNTSPIADYADVVNVAQLYNLADDLCLDEPPCIDIIPAFSKLSLDELDENNNLNVIDEAKDQLNFIEKLLAV